MQSYWLASHFARLCPGASGSTFYSVIAAHKTQIYRASPLVFPSRLVAVLPTRNNTALAETNQKGEKTVSHPTIPLYLSISNFQPFPNLLSGFSLSDTRDRSSVRLRTHLPPEIQTLDNFLIVSL